MNRQSMAVWRAMNNIPEYINAAYVGYTGAKIREFPLRGELCDNAPDITESLIRFEEKIFREINETMKKPLGYFRVLWMMCRNLGTGEAWDTKFLKQFPGRDINGNVQCAKYKGEIVTGNDVSNIFFGHICKFLKIPECIARFVARLDASGIIEPFSKGKLPDMNLLRFRDTPSDQLAISKGYQDYNLSDYCLNP